MPDKQLIERLRRKATKRGLAAITHPSLLNEAADTIERLEAELDTTLLRLEGAATQKANLLSRAKKAEQERERGAAVLEGLLSDGAISRASGVVAQSHPKTKSVGRVIARQVVAAALQHAQEQVGKDRG